MVSVQLMYQAIMVHTCTTQHSVHHTQLFYSHMVSVGQMFQPILVCLHHTASSISSQLSFCAPIPYTHKYTCMPTPKLHFQEQKSPKSGTQHIFRNTSSNISSHLWNKSSYQILQESHRAIYTVLLPYPFCAAENTCLPITLDYLPVQSFHNSTANYRVHKSVTFLVYGDKRPLLMVYFLNPYLTGAPLRKPLCDLSECFPLWEMGP